MAETGKPKHKSQHSEPSNGPQGGRGAYPYLFKQREKRANGAPLTSPRYDMGYLVPKLNVDPTKCANYAWLAGHCMAAAAKEPLWNVAAAGWPAGGHWPIQDGDAPIVPKVVPGQPVLTPAQLAAKYGWRKGYWIVELTSYLPQGPKVAVLSNGQVVEIPAQVVNGIQQYKSGDFCIASIHAYTFQNEKFGCNFGFEGVLWNGASEAIGGGQSRTADQMFGGAGTAPGATAPALPPLPTAAPPVAPAAPMAPPPPPSAPVAAAPAAPGAPPPPPMPR